MSSTESLPLALPVTLTPRERGARECGVCVGGGGGSGAGGGGEDSSQSSPQGVTHPPRAGLNYMLPAKMIAT